MYVQFTCCVYGVNLINLKLKFKLKLADPLKKRILKTARLRDSILIGRESKKRERKELNSVLSAYEAQENKLPAEIFWENDCLGKYKRLL